ncbi:hypothetical protein BS78_04G196500 [Paspalum vaginatum]|nr:hypothetical protein BS78_04G196500 [Paspalum vaginatum]
MAQAAARRRAPRRGAGGGGVSGVPTAEVAPQRAAGPTGSRPRGWRGADGEPRPGEAQHEVQRRERPRGASVPAVAPAPPPRPRRRAAPGPRRRRAAGPFPVGGPPAAGDRGGGERVGAVRVRGRAAAVQVLRVVVAAVGDVPGLRRRGEPRHGGRRRVGGARGVGRADAGRAAQPGRRRVQQEVAPRKHHEPAPRRPGRRGEPLRAVPRQDEPAAAGAAPRRHAVPAGRLLRDHHHLPQHETARVVSVEGEQAGEERRQRERPRQAHQLCAGRQGPGPRKRSRQARSGGQAAALDHVARPRRRVRRPAAAVAGRNVRVLHRIPLQRRRLPRRDEACVRIGQILVGGRGQGGGLRLRAGEAQGVLHGGRAAGPRRELQRVGVREPDVPGAGLQLRRDGAGQPRAGQVPVRAGQRAADGQPVLRARRVRGRRPRQRRADGAGLRRQRRALLHGPRRLRVAGGVEGEQEQEGQHRRLRRGVRRRPGGGVGAV